MAAQKSSNSSSSSTNNTASPNIDVTSPYTPRRPSPIVSVSINHPIGTALRKIKNFLVHKQTLFSTSFNIKVTPIVAFISFLGVAAVFGGGITTAFNFGKTVEGKFLASTPSPTPFVKQNMVPIIITTSKAGVIKATYQYIPTPTTSLKPTSTIVPTTNPVEPTTQNAGQSASITDSPSMLSPTLTPSPIPTPTSKPVASSPILHYILVDRSGSITFLTSSALVHLQNYLNLRVLITGAYNQSTNTLTIGKSSDIEVLQ